MTTYIVRPGLEPLPGIGAGPLDEAEYLAREAAYMAAFADDASSRTPRETGVYLTVEAMGEAETPLPDPPPQGWREPEAAAEAPGGGGGEPTKQPAGRRKAKE